jgi:phosphatidylinositol alpha-mannosyltransferase
LTDQPITIIPNGIDLDKYSQPHVINKSGIQTIQYIGRLERRKGVQYLLRAYQLLQQDHDNVRLVIVGDGPQRERLELMSEDLELANCEFLGFVSEQQKMDLLSSSDLFCSPAIFGESFGIVLLEAMASGTVCVAGNNSGYVDLMQGMGALSITNPVDTPEFARRLVLMLDQAKLRTVWQSWASKYVKQFDYPLIIKKYEELYQDSIERYGRRGK